MRLDAVKLDDVDALGALGKRRVYRGIVSIADAVAVALVSWLSNNPLLLDAVLDAVLRLLAPPVLCNKPVLPN